MIWHNSNAKHVVKMKPYHPFPQDLLPPPPPLPPSGGWPFAMLIKALKTRNVDVGTILANKKESRAPLALVLLLLREEEVTSK